MYDPLKDQSPGIGAPYPNSYWADNATGEPENNGVLQSDIDVDVAIIGGGYTGLSCALYLAKNHNIKAHLLEANQTAWGCSGRNGGFILKSTGRKPYSAMLKQWGSATTHKIYDEVNQGVDSVNQLIEQINADTKIDCEVQTKGYLRIAHKASMVSDLKAQSELLKKEFGYSTKILSSDELRESYFDCENAYGAILFPDGYGINPLRLAWGYQSLAQQAGAEIYTGSPVSRWEQQNNKTVLHTPKGIVTANKVIIATNGYTPKNFHSSIDNRTLPVLSQIIVTQSLTDEQLAETSFLTSNVIMDTRALKYYFRKLPDHR
ncbi:MAG: FAD-binding oxidoreductase, partial [Kangiellaceae bacterium]|nr:FAD-binding oxidoreductase [Kangiellaceae bacterium]